MSSAWSASFRLRGKHYVSIPRWMFGLQAFASFRRDKTKASLLMWLAFFKLCQLRM